MNKACELDERLLKEGWKCAITDKPAPETWVLGLVHGLDAPEVVELVWEKCDPMVEGYFEDFLYWNSVNQDIARLNEQVFAWIDLPEYFGVV